MSKAITTLIEDFSTENLQAFLRTAIPSFKPDEEAFDHLFPEEIYQKYEAILKAGEAQIGKDDLIVIAAQTYEPLTERTGKKKQYDIAKKILKTEAQDAALFVFYDEAGNFRFSFVKANYLGTKRDFTSFKRYTYYVTPKKANKTFRNRIGSVRFDSLEAIQEAFSVEPLSKQFYKELSQWYFAAFKEVNFPNDRNEDEYNLKANALIRLITRMIFVWFMKQKGLISHDFFDKEKVDQLLNYKDQTGSTFYKAILQNLFFATLNTPMGKQRKWLTSSGYGIQNFYRYKRFFKEPDVFLELTKNIPFLNGGLFDSLDIVQTADPEKGIEKKDIRLDCFSDNKKNEKRLTVPDYLFFGTREADISQFFEEGNYERVEIHGLVDILSQYDFTIDENTPDDQEVALDPELLGTVFENLLASYNPETESTARKESGSFYTPRPVVDYMVRESIIYYLIEKTETPEDKLRQLLYEDEAEEISEAERADLTDALSKMTVLDPACGSGAFPMGVLQQMVRLLNILDPENKYWQKAQIKLLQAQTQKAFESQSELEELKARIDEIFADTLSDPDYKRKLFLIQNCLYGADIQPIAMQITKLRFFISLLVEQQIDRSKDNHGILSLPNLETKFVAANSLIRPNTQVGQFKNLSIQALEEELAQVRENYFMARTPKTKRKYRSRDKEIRQEIADLLKNDGFAEDVAQKIAHWDPFNPNSKAEWFDPEWMFGIKYFDVVVGNPPYVQLQKALPGHEKDKYADLYKNIKYKTFERTGDLYALFYEQGIELSRPHTGLLAYITSNKWMRTKYGKSLRNYFAQKRPLQLIDLGPGIFEAATVDTNILLIQNRKTKTHALNALTLERKSQIEPPLNLPFTQMEKLSQESWIVLTPKEMIIKEKIERVGTPLKDWDVNINYGIKTGYNTAFIIDTQTKDQLVAQDPKSAEILKPILRGKDIKRYQAEWAGKWLVATHNGYKVAKGERIPKIDINDYPAVKDWLDSHWKKVEKRYDQGDTPYNLRNCAYWKEFEKEKIIYPNMTKYLPFIYDNQEHYFINDKAFILTGSNLKFLVGYLNSSMGHYFIRQKCAELQGGTRELRKNYMETIPIPTLPSASQQPFIDLADTILAKKSAGEDTSAEEAEIDLMVYKLYELTYEEVKIIDPGFPLTEAAYASYQIQRVWRKGFEITHNELSSRA